VYLNNEVRRSDPVREIVNIQLLGQRLQTADPDKNRFECLDSIPTAFYTIGSSGNFEEFRN